MSTKKEVLYGMDAVKRVEEMEGRKLSLPEQMVVIEEGFVNQPYTDTKGVTTYGVGQTGEWIDKPFSAAYAAHEEDARKLIPTYDTLNAELKGAIMSAAYRGDLQGSPEFRKLFNAGKYEEAAAEFLDNADYRKSLEDKTGVAGRMERVANAVRSMAAQPEESALDSEVSALQPYTIKAGDTLYSISKALGVPVAQIVEDNNITNPNQIAVGQQIFI